MRLTFLYIFVLLSSSVFSQMRSTNYDTIEVSQEYILSGVVDYSATAIEKDITSKFYKGGFISQEIKDRSFDRHGAVNRIGIEASAELSYVNYKTKIFKNKNWGFLIKGGYYNFGGALYSKDFFGLAFYGNSMYVGDTIDMSGSDASFTSFQKLGFGLIDPKSKASITLNAYNISDRISADFRGLEIEQSVAGDEVTLKMDGEVEMKDNLNFMQGFGFGIDVDYRLAIDWGKERTAHIQFLANNIGFAYLNQKQKVYSFDTTFTFSGLHFDEIIGENSIIGDSLNLLDTLGITSKSRNKTILLPGFLQVGKVVDENETRKFQSFFGVRMYPTLIYSPFIYAGVDFKPIQSLHVGANVSYGGFSKLKGGIYANYKWNKLSIGVGSENVVGFFSKRANGESLYFRLRCVI